MENTPKPYYSQDVWAKWAILSPWVAPMIRQAEEMLRKVREEEERKHRLCQNLIELGLTEKQAETMIEKYPMYQIQLFINVLNRNHSSTRSLSEILGKQEFKEKQISKPMNRAERRALMKGSGRRVG